MKLIKDQDVVHPEIDVKRFYIPGYKFKMQCPNCDIPLEKDYSSHYLSYPIMNGIMDEYMYCEDCDDEFKYQVKLNIGLELVEEKDESN